MFCKEIFFYMRIVIFLVIFNRIILLKLFVIVVSVLYGDRYIFLLWRLEFGSLNLIFKRK